MSSHAASVKQTYRFDQSFEWNYVNGPQFSGAYPSVPVTPMKSFFGLPVRSRFGVPSSILSNSRWVETYARLGFDILTFKTVRSVARACGSAPNWMFLDRNGLEDRLYAGDQTMVVGDAPASTQGATMAGSFGMPSVLPQMWEPDLERACRSIGEGQVLIGSVVGSAGPDVSDDAFVADFTDLTRRVCAAGVPIVEANLSCPNVGKAEGQLYLDIERSRTIARAVKEASGGRPVLLKVGLMEEPERLLAFMRAVNGYADGLVLINAPSRRIVAPDGSAAFPPGRERAGVTGTAIKPIALGAGRAAQQIIERERMALQIVGVGGLTCAGDALEFIEAGACAAQSATGAMFNPMLAIEVKAATPAV